MALKDLYNDPASFKYNSKDNKYSKDIRGGGYSGQPWQKVSAPETIDQLNSLTTEALSLDYPIRGGSYEELAARKDFARIDAFLQNYPQGKAFLDKQKGLMFSNPLMESGRSGGDVNTRLYSDGRNLMTQIAEGGTGFRHPNAGRTLNDLEFVERKYEYIVSHKTTQQNRLVNLLNIKINNESPGDLLFSNEATKLGINTVDQGELFFYSGGPGSVYGLGQTIIRRAQDSKGAPIITSNAPMFVGSNYRSGLYSSQVQARPATTINYDLILGTSKVYNLSNDQLGITVSNDFISIDNLNQQSSQDYVRSTNSQPTTIFGYTSNYNQLLSRKPNSGINTEIVPSDFREDAANSSVLSNDYKNPDINIISRVKIGNPGKVTFDRSKVKRDSEITDTDTQDKINMSPIGQYAAGSGNTRDLIKFAFETILNNGLDQSNTMHFRAFLTGYTDNHSAEWSGKRYAGRGENFYTYQGFDRQVSFNFKVAAQSKAEMKYLYSKLNYLVSTLYPDYDGNGFMKGNITKLTIGDLFVRTPGVLTSLNLTVDDQYAWEIALNEPESGSSSDMLEVPQIIDVAVSFIPILRHLPKNGTSSPILLTANSNNSLRWLNSR